MFCQPVLRSGELDTPQSNDTCARGAQTSKNLCFYAGWSKHPVVCPAPPSAPCPLHEERPRGFPSPSCPCSSPALTSDQDVAPTGTRGSEGGGGLTLMAALVNLTCLSADPSPRFETVPMYVLALLAEAPPAFGRPPCMFYIAKNHAQKLADGYPTPNLFRPTAAFSTVRRDGNMYVCGWEHIPHKRRCCTILSHYPPCLVGLTTHRSACHL